MENNSQQQRRHFSSRARHGNNTTPVTAGIGLSFGANGTHNSIENNINTNTSSSAVGSAFPSAVGTPTVPLPPPSASSAGASHSSFHLLAGGSTQTTGHHHQQQQQHQFSNFISGTLSQQQQHAYSAAGAVSQQHHHAAGRMSPSFGPASSGTPLSLPKHPKGPTTPSLIASDPYAAAPVAPVGALARSGTATSPMSSFYSSSAVGGGGVGESASGGGLTASGAASMPTSGSSIHSPPALQPQQQQQQHGANNNSTVSSPSRISALGATAAAAATSPPSAATATPRQQQQHMSASIFIEKMKIFVDFIERNNGVLSIGRASTNNNNSSSSNGGNAAATCNATHAPPTTPSISFASGIDGNSGEKVPLLGAGSDRVVVSEANSDAFAALSRRSLRWGGVNSVIGEESGSGHQQQHLTPARHPQRTSFTPASSSSAASPPQLQQQQLPPHSPTSSSSHQTVGSGGMGTPEGSNGPAPNANTPHVPPPTAAAGPPPLAPRFAKPPSPNTLLTPPSPSTILTVLGNFPAAPPPQHILTVNTTAGGGVVFSSAFPSRPPSAIASPSAPASPQISAHPIDYGGALAPPSTASPPVSGGGGGSGPLSASVSPPLGSTATTLRAASTSARQTPTTLLATATASAAAAQQQTFAGRLHRFLILSAQQQQQNQHSAVAAASITTPRSCSSSTASDGVPLTAAASLLIREASGFDARIEAMERVLKNESIGQSIATSGPPSVATTRGGATTANISGGVEATPTMNNNNINSTSRLRVSAPSSADYGDLSDEGNGAAGKPSRAEKEEQRAANALTSAATATTTSASPSSHQPSHQPQRSPHSVATAHGRTARHNQRHVEAQQQQLQSDGVGSQLSPIQVLNGLRRIVRIPATANLSGDATTTSAATYSFMTSAVPLLFSLQFPTAGRRFDLLSLLPSGDPIREEVARLTESILRFSVREQLNAAALHQQRLMGNNNEGNGSIGESSAFSGPAVAVNGNGTEVASSPLLLLGGTKRPRPSALGTAASTPVTASIAAVGGAVGTASAPHVTSHRAAAEDSPTITPIPRPFSSATAGGGRVHVGSYATDSDNAASSRSPRRGGGAAAGETSDDTDGGGGGGALSSLSGVGNAYSHPVGGRFPATNAPSQRSGNMGGVGMPPLSGMGVNRSGGGADDNQNEREEEERYEEEEDATAHSPTTAARLSGGGGSRRVETPIQATNATSSAVHSRLQPPPASTAGIVAASATVAAVAPVNIRHYDSMAVIMRRAPAAGHALSAAIRHHLDLIRIFIALVGRFSFVIDACFAFPKPSSSSQTKAAASTNNSNAATNSALVGSNANSGWGRGGGGGSPLVGSAPPPHSSGTCLTPSSLHTFVQSANTIACSSTSRNNSNFIFDMSREQTAVVVNGDTGSFDRRHSGSVVADLRNSADEKRHFGGDDGEEEDEDPLVGIASAPPATTATSGPTAMASLLSGSTHTQHFSASSHKSLSAAEVTPNNSSGGDGSGSGASASQHQQSLTINANGNTVGNGDQQTPLGLSNSIATATAAQALQYFVAGGSCSNLASLNNSSSTAPLPQFHQHQQQQQQVNPRPVFPASVTAAAAGTSIAPPPSSTAKKSGEGAEPSANGVGARRPLSNGTATLTAVRFPSIATPAAGDFLTPSPPHSGGAGVHHLQSPPHTQTAAPVSSGGSGVFGGGSSVWGGSGTPSSLPLSGGGAATAARPPSSIAAAAAAMAAARARANSSRAATPHFSQAFAAAAPASGGAVSNFNSSFSEEKRGQPVPSASAAAALLAAAMSQRNSGTPSTAAISAPASGAAAGSNSYIPPPTPSLIMSVPPTPKHAGVTGSGGNYFSIATPQHRGFNEGVMIGAAADTTPGASSPSFGPNQPPGSVLMAPIGGAFQQADPFYLPSASAAGAVVTAAAATASGNASSALYTSSLPPTPAALQRPVPQTQSQAPPLSSSAALIGGISGYYGVREGATNSRAPTPGASVSFLLNPVAPTVNDSDKNPSSHLRATAPNSDGGMGMDSAGAVGGGGSLILEEGYSGFRLSSSTATGTSANDHNSARALPPSGPSPSSLHGTPQRTLRPPSATLFLSSSASAVHAASGVGSGASASGSPHTSLGTPLYPTAAATSAPAVSVEAIVGGESHGVSAMRRSLSPDATANTVAAVNCTRSGSSGSAVLSLSPSALSAPSSRQGSALLTHAHTNGVGFSHNTAAIMATTGPASAFGFAVVPPTPHSATTAASPQSSAALVAAALASTPHATPLQAGKYISVESVRLSEAQRAALEAQRCETVALLEALTVAAARENGDADRAASLPSAVGYGGDDDSASLPPPNLHDTMIPLSGIGGHSVVADRLNPITAAATNDSANGGGEGAGGTLSSSFVALPYPTPQIPTVAAVITAAEEAEVAANYSTPTGHGPSAATAYPTTAFATAHPTALPSSVAQWLAANQPLCYALSLAEGTHNQQQHVQISDDATLTPPRGHSSQGQNSRSLHLLFQQSHAWSLPLASAAATSEHAPATTTTAATTVTAAATTANSSRHLTFDLIPNGRSLPVEPNNAAAIAAFLELKLRKISQLQLEQNVRDQVIAAAMMGGGAPSGMPSRSQSQTPASFFFGGGASAAGRAQTPLSASFSAGVVVSRDGSGILSGFGGVPAVAATPASGVGSSHGIMGGGAADASMASLALAGGVGGFGVGPRGRSRGMMEPET